MHKITIFNLGNADTSRIDLANGKKLLIDYADMRCDDDPKDKRIDLPVQLRVDLKNSGRTDYDVVAFTHLDNDHTCGASDFFLVPDGFVVDVQRSCVLRCASCLVIVVNRMS